MWLSQNKIFMYNPRSCCSFLNLWFLFAKYSGFLFSSAAKDAEEEGKWEMAVSRVLSSQSGLYLF